MSKSMLPPAGGNLFQMIKAQRAAAEARGIKIINLAIGQPSGPAILQARIAAVEAVMSSDEVMHEYQDNGSPGVPGFAMRFVKANLSDNVQVPFSNTLLIDTLPIPGIKPMLAEVIKSLGTWCGEKRQATVFTMTNPGYPTPADQCQTVPGIRHKHLPLDPENGFLFDLDWFEHEVEEGDLVMLNFPHNPTGIISTTPWLWKFCKICIRKGVRVFNDAAYSILSHSDNSTTLTEIAIEFPGLSWAEAFSASKAGNFTGWRVGAMVGSPDFIGDVKRVKGNSDSGFVAFAAAGIIHLYENHRDKIEAVRNTYAERLNLVQCRLESRDMKIAVYPKAGFFLLFHCPKKAFGQDIHDALEFNELMINQTGVMGVPFGKYIRYAICATDVVACKDSISDGFYKANVSY